MGIELDTKPTMDTKPTIETKPTMETKAAMEMKATMETKSMTEVKPKTKLKIGIMTCDIEKLDKWEYLILEGILECPDLELALFIKDGRGQAYPPKRRLKSRLRRNLLTPKVFVNIIYWLQMKIESLLFRQAGLFSDGDINSIINKTKGVETIYLNPKRKGFCDVFSKEDSERVKAYGLDIILRHEFNIIQGEVLNAARYGIWSFHHGDNAINRGYPPGFWEIVNNEPCCGVTLQQLTPELDGGLIIDKAWFDRHWSSYKNNNDLLDKSVVMLFKNIDKLLRQGGVETVKSLVYYNRLYTKPTLKVFLNYLWKFYTYAIYHAFQKACPFGRLNCWALFFGRGDFLETALFRVKPIPMPKNVFWADPFLYRYENQLYVFFENFSYKTKKGKISCGRIVENDKGRYSIEDVRDALDFDYHMSYPQIVEEGGDIFMIPETAANKRLEVYRCARFPDEWELYATAFDGEEVIETTYFRDENGYKWLFLNKGRAAEAELYIYRISSLKLESIEGHALNPVIVDCKKGRNGGAPFKYGNECYRPSQINTHGVYGRGIHISKIKKLTLEEYEDEEVVSIEPNFRKGLVGTHHLHQIEGAFIFDACFKRL